MKTGTQTYTGSLCGKCNTKEKLKSNRKCRECNIRNSAARKTKTKRPKPAPVTPTVDVGAKLLAMRW